MRVTAIVLNVFVLHAVIVKFAEDLLWRYARSIPRWLTSVSLPFHRYGQTATSPCRPGAAPASRRVIADPPITEAPMHDEPITECGSRPSGFQRLFQRIERGAGEGEHLFALVQQVQFVEAQVLIITMSRS